MSAVIFKKAAYDYETLRPVIFSMIDALDNNLIKNQSQVLLKPNFLSPAKPEKAIITHPLVVRAVAEYVLDRGAHLQISDSPAVGSFERVMKEGAYKAAFEDLDVEFCPFKTSARVDVGEPFGSIEIAKRAVEADVVINLAKLKTHTQMLLTLGVKNLFGCIVGFKKPEWHMRCGIDRKMFARLLVQIYQAIKPALTIVDGILALEGQGPGRRGKPRHTGVIVGGHSGLATDIAICRMIGIEPDRLPTNKAAGELGLGEATVDVCGDFSAVDDFKLPELAPLTYGPKRLQGFMRKHLVQRPVVDQKLCKLCGECWEYCPAKAITAYEEIIGFDYDRCIRCYCCVEVCPHGALRAVETMPGKIVRRLSKVSG